MLKLRSLGIDDYSVLEASQRIGRIRLAGERMPPFWLWNVTIHLPGGLPMGSSPDYDTAKAEFKAAWEALKARTPPEQLASALEDARPVQQRKPTSPIILFRGQGRRGRAFHSFSHS